MPRYFAPKKPLSSETPPRVVMVVLRELDFGVVDVVLVRSDGGYLLQVGRRPARVHDDVLGGVIRHVAVAVPGVDVTHLLAAAPRTPRRQDTLERLAELGVEDRVDDRVERGVGVPEPGQHLERLRSDAGLAERRDDVDAEEGHPAN